MLLGMLYSCHWCWSGPGWLTSTFDPKIAFFLILPTMEKNRGIFSPGPGKRPKISIFSKFFFRTFFYHPEIPSSLYGATDGLWRPHGARFILLAPICGWGGGGVGVEIIGLAFYPHTPLSTSYFNRTPFRNIYIDRSTRRGSRNTAITPFG